jgi:hypothetical protein
MEFETIDSARGELPEEYRSYFQGTARVQRFTSPFGDRPAVSAVHFDAGARTRLSASSGNVCRAHGESGPPLAAFSSSTHSLCAFVLRSCQRRP